MCISRDVLQGRVSPRMATVVLPNFTMSLTMPHSILCVVGRCTCVSRGCIHNTKGVPASHAKPMASPHVRHSGAWHCHTGAQPQT